MQPKQLPGFQYRDAVYDPNQVAIMLQAKQIQRQKAKQPVPKPKQQGKGGFLSSIISELGGAGGAAGGAAIGTALLPGVGTLIGAGLGGFLGGTGGRVAENKIRDNRIGLGDALKEGTLAGALSAAGSGYNLYKGAKAAKAGVDGASKLTKMGRGLTEYGSGLKIDPAVGGINKADELASFMSKYKGTPRKQLRLMTQDMSRLGSEVDSILTNTPIKLKGSQVTKTLQQGFKDPTNPLFADLDLTSSAAQKYLNSYAAKFNRLDGAKAVNDQLKTIQSLASRANSKLFAGGAASPLTAQETAALAIKRSADDVLGQIKEIAPLKQQMAKIFEANPMVTGASGKVLGAPMIGVKVPKLGQAARGAASYAGGVMQGGSKVAAPVTGGILEQTLKGIPKNLKMQAPGNIYGALGGDTQPMEQQAPPQSEDEQLMQIYEQLSGGQAPMGGQETGQDPMGQMGGQMQPEQPTYTLQQAMADIAQYPKDQAKIMNYYQFVNEAQQAAKPAKPLSTAAKQQNALVMTGSNAIQNLRSMFQKDPGLIAKTGVPGRNVLGIGNRVLGLGQYEAMAQQAIDSVARLRTGAAMTPSEETFYRRMVPQAGDDQATINQKLDELERYFASFQNEPGADEGLDQQAVMQQGAF